MPADQLITAPSPTTTTPLRRKLFDIFVTPGEVFDEVAVAPPKLANWLAPTALICLGAILWPACFASADAPRGNEAARVLATALGPLIGSIWSGFILWIIGRIFLRSKFSYLKSLEVIGLSSTILILGGVVTGLLIVVVGNDAARPALSFFFLSSRRADHLIAALDVLNFFHIWSAILMAIGLSRLTGVSAKEAAFWTLSYWIALRIALVLLS